MIRKQRSKRRGALMTAAIACAALAVAGCGSSSSSSSGSGSSSGGSATATNASSSGGTVKIGSVVQSLQNPWVDNDVRFQKAVAKALGINLVVAADNLTDESNEQVTQNLIADGVKGVDLDPFSQASGIADSHYMEQYHVPFVDEDREFDTDINDYQGKEFVAQSTDAAQHSGFVIATSLIDQGATRIVTIFPPKGNTVVEAGMVGVMQAIAQHPGVKLVQQEWVNQTYNTAVTTMQQLLTKYKPGQINGVFGIGATMALGAAYAIQQAGRSSQFHLATWDDTPQAIQDIQNGTLVETQGGAWLEGGFMLIALYDYLHGHKPLNRQPLYTQITVNKATAALYNREFINGVPLTASQIRCLSLTYNPKANLPQFIEDFADNWQKPNAGLPASCSAG
jgi:ABC-type sugar transport system substrate-binding protein